MENVPLRQHLKELLSQHTQHVDGQFDRVHQRLDAIEDAARTDRVHIHPEMPTWPQVWAALSVVASLVGGLIVVLT